MGPSRKKSKPNPPKVEEPSQSSQQAIDGSTSTTAEAVATADLGSGKPGDDVVGSLKDKSKDVKNDMNSKKEVSIMYTFTLVMTSTRKAYISWGYSG